MVFIRSGTKTRIKCPWCGRHKTVVPAALAVAAAFEGEERIEFRTYVCLHCSRYFRVQLREGTKE